MLSLNNLQGSRGSRHNSKRLGRGIGSGKGKTAGKGHKGQKARKGVSIRWFEGGQTSLIKRLPKRGFNPISKNTFSLVSFIDISKILESNNSKEIRNIDNRVLFEFSIIKSPDEKVKLLNNGEFLYKDIVFNLDNYSNSAKQKVESLGGKCI